VLLRERYRYRTRASAGTHARELEQGLYPPNRCVFQTFREKKILRSPIITDETPLAMAFCCANSSGTTPLLVHRPTDPSPLGPEPCRWKVRRRAPRSRGDARGPGCAHVVALTRGVPR